MGGTPPFPMCTYNEKTKKEVILMCRKKAKKNQQRVVRCPYCGAVAVIRPASEIYQDERRKDELYVCRNYPSCKAYVGIYPGTKTPMGVLANGDLRNLRIRAHRKFDRLWQSGIMSRQDAYRWMADYFCLPQKEAHIGMFSEYRCNELIKKCDSLLAPSQSAAS